MQLIVNVGAIPRTSGYCVLREDAQNVIIVAGMLVNDEIHRHIQLWQFFLDTLS